MPEPVTPPIPEPEPEPAGVVDVQGQKLVPLAALVAERERIRTISEEKHQKELEPLKTKAAHADQLEADLAAVQPHLEYLKQHPELMKREEAPEVQAVTDEEAERYARRYELYTPQGLDLTRARHIIADNRKEMKQVAEEAAREAVKPLAATTAG